MAGGPAVELDWSTDRQGGATVSGGQRGRPGAWEGRSASGGRNRGQKDRKKGVHPTGSDRYLARQRRCGWPASVRLATR